MSGRFGCVGLVLAFFLICLIEWKHGMKAGVEARRDGESVRATKLPLAHRQRIIQQAAPDVAKYLPLPFDRTYDNPCFQNGSSLLCLPAFFVAGGMQCGGWDLWRRLKAHEHISDHHDPAPHWWTNHPRSTAGSFDRYLSLFSDRKTLAQVRSPLLIMARCTAPTHYGAMHGPYSLWRRWVASPYDGAGLRAAAHLTLNPNPKPTPTQVRAQPHTLLGDVSPASFAFMMAEQLRIHYQADR